MNTDIFYILQQRHKLGSNLTPVTPESFAKWKKTRMDKKEAEQEAMRKAKEVQSSAGKNSGMSGRDLVRFHLLPGLSDSSIFLHLSSNTIPNGSQTRTMAMLQTTGTLNSLEDRRSRRILLLKNSGSPTCHLRKEGLTKAVVVVEDKLDAVVLLQSLACLCIGTIIISSSLMWPTCAIRLDNSYFCMYFC